MTLVFHTSKIPNHDADASQVAMARTAHARMWVLAVEME
jgi:hypothetical protein